MRVNRIINKLFSDKKKKDNILPILGGTVSIGAGVKLLKNSDPNKITGRVNLYHATTEKAKESILKEGIKGKYALDPKSSTNIDLDNLGIKDGRKLVYLAKDKDVADTMKLAIESKGKTPDLVEISIPYDEYKRMKRVYDNPEFGGTDNYKDWLEKSGLEEEFREEIAERNGMKDYYDNFSGAKGTPGTRIIEGDIDSKYIKGSNNYQKFTRKELLNYIKNNPRRFGKEAGKYALASSLIVGGAGVITDSLLKNIKKKNVDEDK